LTAPSRTAILKGRHFGRGFNIKEKDPLVIYWAPAFHPTDGPNWNMLYQEPENLFNELIKNKEKLSTRDSFFSCPAVTGRIKNSFVFKNNLKTKFYYDFTDKNNPIVEPIEGVEAKYFKPSALINGSNVMLRMNWIFFAEESVDLLVNSTMFHKTNLSEHGFIVPGKYDPSKWFRPVTCEIQLWGTKGEVTIKEDDPLFYIEAMTDRKIILKRFKFNEALVKYMEACTSAPHYFGSFLPLKDRYKKFTKTKTDALILEEIKKNLV
jgi:hypothetical protein